MLSNVGVQDFAVWDEASHPEIKKLLRSGQAAPGLAVYASNAALSRGRRFFEDQCPSRSAFARDRDRITHAAAFRRLAHKTQVFIYDEGDHYRNRLTHSLEVAQVGRSLASILQLDEDLTEAICLAHDIGHTPFGHAGERALSRTLKGFGGFDHNVQTLRVLTELEGRYPAFDGLNLSWETLEGLVKHNGPLVTSTTEPVQLPDVLTRFEADYDFGLAHHAGGEAQVAALADDIAYNSHDIDDGLRAGLFTIDDLRAVPLVWQLIVQIRLDYPQIEDKKLVFEMNRRLITAMIADVVRESRLRLQKLDPGTADDIRRSDRLVIDFSPEFNNRLEVLRGFLYENLYRSEQVMSVMHDAEKIVEDLVVHYMDHPKDLPREWSCSSTRININQCAGRIRDFIAGMTDRYAVELHRSLFDLTPKLR